MEHINSLDQRYAIVEAAELGRYQPRDVDFRFPRSWQSLQPRSPFAMEAQKDTIAWFDSLGLIPSEDVRKRVLSMDIAGYAGYSLPMASYEDFLVYTRFLTLWLLWDDQVVERMEGSALDEHLEQALEALEGNLLPAEAKDPYVRAWAELAQEYLRLGRDKAFLKRLSIGFRQWLDNCLLELIIAHALKQDRMGLKQYSWERFLEIRMYTIGMFPTMLLIEQSLGIDLPEYVREDPAIKRLARLAALLVACGNEVSSAPKDYRASWPNWMSFYQLLNDCSIGECYEAMAEMNRKAIQEFDEIAANLPSWGSPIDAWVQAWVCSLRYCVSGFARWHAEAPRYHQHSIVNSVEKRYFRLQMGITDPTPLLNPPALRIPQPRLAT